jgi:hypothetical protein
MGRIKDPLSPDEKFNGFHGWVGRKTLSQLPTVTADAGQLRRQGLDG